MSAAETPVDLDQVRAIVRRALERGQPETAESPSSAASADIAIGADHGGWAMKQALLAHLRAKGYRLQDCGCHDESAVDYPDVAQKVATRVADGRCRYGIMVDGAGIGSCMAANKVRGVRAALCYDISSARNSREHNHANLLCLGAGLIGQGLAAQIVDAWLDTPWAGGRHQKRVEKIMALEAPA